MSRIATCSPIRRPGALADPSNIGQSGSGRLGNCGYTRCFWLSVTAELCRASKVSKGRHCCTKAIASAVSRHNPELGISGQSPKRDLLFHRRGTETLRNTKQKL